MGFLVGLYQFLIPNPVGLKNHMAVGYETCAIEARTLHNLDAHPVSPGPREASIARNQRRS